MTAVKYLVAVSMFVKLSMLKSVSAVSLLLDKRGVNVLAFPTFL